MFILRNAFIRERDRCFSQGSAFWSLHGIQLAGPGKLRSPSHVPFATRNAFTLERDSFFRSRRSAAGGQPGWLLQDLNQGSEGEHARGSHVAQIAEGMHLCPHRQSFV